MDTPFTRHKHQKSHKLDQKPTATSCSPSKKESSKTYKSTLKPPNHFDRSTLDRNTARAHSNMSNGEIDIMMKAKAFSFNPKNNTYIIKLENVRVLSQNLQSNPPAVIFEIAPHQIHQAYQTQLLHADDIDAILDEIEHNETPTNIHMTSMNGNNAHMVSAVSVSVNSPLQHHHQHYPTNLCDVSGDHAAQQLHPSMHRYSLSYSAQKRHRIKESHIREASKQQIPTIHDAHSAPQPQHSVDNTVDSLQSIPPLPVILNELPPPPPPLPPPQPQLQSHESNSTQNRGKRSYNKYRDADKKRNVDDVKHKQRIDEQKQQLIAAWNVIHVKHQQEQCLDGSCVMHDCQCVARVRFLLFHYSNWVKLRTTKAHRRMSNEERDVMLHYENITTLFEDLHYDAVALANDFEHIRAFHINNNSSVPASEPHVNSAGADEETHHDDDDDDLLESVSQHQGGDAPVLQVRTRGNAMDATHRVAPSESQQQHHARHDSAEFFASVLGKCDAKQCNILLRHCRDRHTIDNRQEHKRRKLFFISSRSSTSSSSSRHSGSSSRSRKSNENDASAGGERRSGNRALRLKEVHLESKLDVIHTALLHQQTNVMLLNKHKFITRITQKPATDERKEEQEVGVRLNQHGLVNKKKIMPFGESITYWDAQHHLYCAQKYSSLKNELLENKLYSLSLDVFEQVEYGCVCFLREDGGKQLVAMREHDWMRKYRIVSGRQISLDHLLALFTYTNLPALRTAFVEVGYRHYYNHDTVDKTRLLELHSEIWNWSRLLLECVHCFGSPFKEHWRYYHGVNCKLLFDRFNLMIDVPSSVTLDKDFAYTLSAAPDAGIMVELNHGTLSDVQSLCFDNSLLSEFPFEEERFIFHSYVSIKDIVINGLHHDQWLKIFRFWYKVKEGFFFNHLLSDMEITKNDQLCICAMIVNMMLGASNQRHPQYDQRIPFYMQCLFDECIQDKAFVWIIESEYERLAPKLKSLLFYNSTNLTKSSQFLRFLIADKKCNVCKCNTFVWHINDKAFQSLMYGQHEWIASSKYKIYLYLNGDFGTTHCLTFHFECQDKPKNGMFRCRVHLDDYPPLIAKVNLGIGIFVDKVNVDNYSYAEIKCSEKLYNSSLHSLFETKQLKRFHSVNLKLQIQLFYLHDQNGQMIKFQPV